MPCTATIPNLTAREQAHHLYEAIPPGLFRVEDENERIAWRVSPEPFALSAELAEQIERLGVELLALLSRAQQRSTIAARAEPRRRSSPSISTAASPSKSSSSRARTASSKRSRA